MSGPRLHHHGIAVDDVERAIDFYVEALEARVAFTPIELDAGGTMRWRGALIKLAMVIAGEIYLELFEFLEPDVPDWARGPHEAKVPHLGLMVDDLDATLERWVGAGGTTVWPRIASMAGARMIYVADPFGNVVELIDGDGDAIVRALLRDHPHAAPDTA